MIALSWLEEGGIGGKEDRGKGNSLDYRHKLLYSWLLQGLRLEYNSFLANAWRLSNTSRHVMRGVCAWVYV